MDDAFFAVIAMVPKNNLGLVNLSVELARRLVGQPLP